MPKESNKKDYEISFLAKEESGLSEVQKTLVRAGAEVTMTGPLERIVLAYKIEGEVSAYFGFFHFASEPANIKDIEHDLTANSTVLRSLIVTPPFVKTRSRGLGPKPKGPVPTEETQPERQAPVASGPLSNEALEKKIEEILQQ